MSEQGQDFPAEMVELAWHTVIYDEDDACPVMKIVLHTECPFPEDPEPNDPTCTP